MGIAWEKFTRKNGVFMDRGVLDLKNCIVTFEKGVDYTEKTRFISSISLAKGISRHILTTRIKSAIMQVKPRKGPQDTRIRSGR